MQLVLFLMINFMFNIASVLCIVGCEDDFQQVVRYETNSKLGFACTETIETSCVLAAPTRHAMLCDSYASLVYNNV